MESEVFEVRHGEAAPGGSAAARRAELWALLGDLPERRLPTATLVATERVEGGTLERLLLDLNGIELVPALVAVPDQRPEQAPGMLYMHAHDYANGKEELVLGRPKLHGSYLPDLMARGVVTLCIDAWCFGERARHDDPARGEHDAFKRMLWEGQVLFGMMVFDQQQALTYLASRPEVDGERLGVMGLSMGSTQSWWLAALDERVTVCLDLCCLTDYEELLRTDWLVGHGIYYYVPSLLKHFTSAEINALIAPRARLSLNGEHDPLTPPAGVQKIAAELDAVYASMGAADMCRIELFDIGHAENAEMRALGVEWIERHLCR